MRISSCPVSAEHHRALTVQPRDRCPGIVSSSVERHRFLALAYRVSNSCLSLLDPVVAIVPIQAHRVRSGAYRYRTGMALSDSSKAKLRHFDRECIGDYTTGRNRATCGRLHHAVSLRK
jgi:hypothetical protein